MARPAPNDNSQRQSSNRFDLLFAHCCHLRLATRSLLGWVFSNLQMIFARFDLVLFARGECWEWRLPVGTESGGNGHLVGADRRALGKRAAFESAQTKRTVGLDVSQH